MDRVNKFIKQYNLVIDKSKSSDEILYVRASICSEKQSLNFVEQLSKESGTEWVAHSEMFDTCTKRFECCRAWVCSDANIITKGMACCYKNRIVKMEILIKEINHSTKRVDTFLSNKPPLASIIRFTLHYHCRCKLFYKHLNVHNDVKELFFSYFTKGYSPTQAKNLFIEDRQKNEDCKINRFVPSKRRLSYLYALWREKMKTSKNPMSSDGKAVVDKVDLEVDEDKMSVDNCIPSIKREPEIDEVYSEVKVNPVDQVILMKDINNSTRKITTKRSPASDVLFDFQTFINAIPHKDPPSRKSRCKYKKNEDYVPDSPSTLDSDSEPHLIIADDKTSFDAPVKKLDRLPENISVNNTPACKNSNLSPACAQRQVVSVNTSPNHMNGSVTTVNSSDIITSSLSLNGGQVTEISNFPSKDLNTNLPTPAIISVLDTKDLNSSESCIEYGNNSVLCETNEHKSDFPFTPLMFPDIIKANVTKNSVPDIKDVKIMTKSNIQISPQKNLEVPLSSYNISTVQSPSHSTISNCIANDLSRSVLTKSEQIHITSTAHQSGAHVSMEPVCQKSKVVDTICFSDCQTTLPSLVGFIKIKKQPEVGLQIIPKEPKEIKVKEPKLPIIAKVFSLSGKQMSVKEEPLPVSVIKVEKSSNGESENAIKDLWDSTADEASKDEVLEDDHDFVLSLLPHLSQMSDNLKRLVKRDIKTLISSAVDQENSRKKIKLTCYKGGMI